ncbi:MAG: serine protease [Actinomycetota bacterium]|nr:serine protease [Actinomycetota bacterium]
MKHCPTLALAVIGALALAPSTAAAWAPAGGATIHPGVQTNTEGSGQCTSNFVYTNGSEVLLGQAAHCAGTGEASDTNGCEADSLPLGTRVEIDGASRPGTIAYSSWLTMQGNNESDANACEYNDLALVKVDPADVSKLNPSVPGFGGPTASTATVGNATTVYSYGNSSLRGGVTTLSPKLGNVVNTTGGGWSHTVYTVTPGVPGDSGSGFFDAQGRAFGTLSTLGIAPLPASNGVSNLTKELAYARANGLGGLTLVNGTLAFSPNIVGAIIGAS